MRERPKSIAVRTFSAGITPARAGTTFTFTAPYSRIQDHPRSCGNDYYEELKRVSKEGSPPLVRERLRLCASSPDIRRITPARAGTTSDGWITKMAIKDHPRSCGNDSQGANLNQIVMGSPPLVRERRWVCIQVEKITRITPACAGTTGIITFLGNTYRDHPRLCGNDRFLDCMCAYKQGSPPLVRERRWGQFNIHTYCRITPACAGTTFEETAE